MRITFVMASGFALSGGDRVVAIYADRLKKLGHEVCVVSRCRKTASLREQIRSLRKGKGLISTRNRPSHFDHLDIPHWTTDTFRPVTDADVPDADVVIATWWETAEWVANLSSAKGAKAYFVQHHEVFDYLPKEKAEASYNLPLHKIAISQWLVDIMQTRYNDRQVSFVPNGVDTQQFNAPLRGKQSVPTIGMVYASPPWKGCDISLKAFSIAAQRIPNLKLVTFGNEPPSRDLPLPPDAEFVAAPQQNLLKNLYSRCDAWLFGSRLEGFGLPILEAMACRTPVIGTPAGAAPELLADGAGILVQPEDPEDMAKAIEKICHLSEQDWQQMSNAAYAKATAYCWEDAARQFEAALQTAIDRQKRGDWDI